MLVNVVATWTPFSGERFESIDRINEVADIWALGDAVRVGHWFADDCES
jgi:hypothetical protein